MIRRVAFGKAIAAGAAGALAWEAAVRLPIAAGLPLFDIVRTMGTLVAGSGGPLRWWPAGVVLHMLVGGVWAIFYAYFFWSTWDWRPATQGAVFALGPAALAGLVMVPQFALMHPLMLRGEMAPPGTFASNLGWGGPAGLVLGHLVYGAVMGGLYTRPVGRRVRRERARG